MIKNIAIPLLALISYSAADAGTVWNILNIESGCAPINSIYADYDYLINIKNPGRIFKKIKEIFPDAKLIPIVKVIASERMEDKDAPSKEELDFFKDFTESNALQIISLKGGIELNFVTTDLCNKLMAPKIEKNR